MSREIVALLRERPELAPLLHSLRGKGLAVAEHDNTTHLYDAAGRLLVHIAHPLRIDVPGEVERLLNTSVPLPVWWVGVRAAATLTEAGPLARRCAETLVSRHGGTLWSNR
ncbi:hypothetical protein GCM10023085_11530 [Actinomadura viridis]|uniref:Uncharacterized protein n=1 Tax=Actinomadura viridis TaxID=58110 RepID=A0A931GP31_9ACTN|nr:hypothetical protein [Actinomadura viridis]MBG6093530.1 hypothetical protein [Actinomadura viridis]